MSPQEIFARLGTTPEQLRETADAFDEMAKVTPTGSFATTAALIRLIAGLTDRVNELERIVRVI